MLAGVFACGFIGAIVIAQSSFKIIGMADVKPASGILEDVNPVHDCKVGSRGRARTCNHTVNSRVLYH